MNFTTCRSTAWGKTGILFGLIWLMCLLAGAEATAQKSPSQPFLKTHSASDLHAALFFKSVIAQETSEPVLFSLNPSDQQLAPAILDTRTGHLRFVQVPSSPIDGIQILRVTSLGAFNSRFAPASALIREGTLERNAFGYINADGEWVIAPRYALAQTPVNRWAVVSESIKISARDVLVLDLEQRKPVYFPSDKFLMFDKLTPIGDHVGVYSYSPRARDDGGSLEKLLINSTTGAVMSLPSWGRPENKGSGVQLDVDKGKVFDVDSGRVIPRPFLPSNRPRVVPGLLVEQIQDTDGSESAKADASPKKIVVKKLLYTTPLTNTLYIACDQGENLIPGVSFGDSSYLDAIDVSSKLRCGLMDANAKWRTKSDYQHFYFPGNEQVVMRNAREWCTLDMRGSDAGLCSEKVPAVMLNAGLWIDAQRVTSHGQDKINVFFGYRDANNKLAIPYLFEYASPFNGQIAAVTQWRVPGLIDAKGRWLTPPPPKHVVQWMQEYNARSFAPMCESCYGLIDRTGGWVFPPVFYGAANSPEGRFLFSIYGDSNRWLETDSTGRLFNIFYFDDRFRERAENPQSSHTDFDLSTLPNDIVATCVNGLCGLTNADSKWLVTARFLNVIVLSNTRALAQTKEGWGLMNQKGEWLKKPTYNSVELLGGELISGCWTSQCDTLNFEGRVLEFAEGLSAAMTFGSNNLAPAQDARTDLWGYIDRTGRWAIQPIYKKALPFSGNHAAVQVDAPTDTLAEMNSQNTGKSLPVVVDVKQWSSAKMASVTVLPREYVPQASKRSRDRGKYYDKLQTGLMGNDGQWIVPVRSQWLPANSTAPLKK